MSKPKTAKKPAAKKTPRKPAAKKPARAPGASGTMTTKHLAGLPRHSDEVASLKGAALVDIAGQMSKQAEGVIGDPLAAEIARVSGKNVIIGPADLLFTAIAVNVAMSSHEKDQRAWAEKTSGAMTKYLDRARAAQGATSGYMQTAQRLITAVPELLMQAYTSGSRGKGKKGSAKKPAAKKTSRKPAAKKAPAKKSTAKKPAAKKSAAKKTPSKKSVARQPRRGQRGQKA